MNILSVSRDSLVDKGKNISVAIIDGGFDRIPSYARVIGENKSPLHEHGNKILSIFTALDLKYPIKNLELYLCCYDNSTGYSGIISLLETIPKCDIISLSLAWKDYHPELHSTLISKATRIFVPCSVGTERPYPALYGPTMTRCSTAIDPMADFCINPVPEWKGNSFAVPAIARLVAHGFRTPTSEEDSVSVEELFQSLQKKKASPTTKETTQFPIVCKHCNRKIVTRAFVPVTKKPDRCPYCGMIP